MAFDWQRFFDQYGVQYDTAGANVSGDNVVVHCPFCGAGDPSKHMSVNLKGRGWRCWRHPDHRGKNPTRLVQGILGCTWERAAQITGTTTFIPDDFFARVKSQFDDQSISARDPLTLPQEFKPFADKPSARPYVRYLRERGFSEKAIARLTKRYGVYYCTSGPYRGRIVFTVTCDGQLISWTGRTIYPDVELRYKTLSIDEERAAKERLKPALGAISHYLLWYDQLMRTDADTLFLCEGPFDALKVAVLGRKLGITATCFFTSSPTQAQVGMLHDVLPRFQRKVLLLDHGAIAVALKTMPWLSGLGIELGFLPQKLKDPGEFDKTTFSHFVLAQNLTAD